MSFKFEAVTFSPFGIRREHAKVRCMDALFLLLFVVLYFTSYSSTCALVTWSIFWRSDNVEMSRTSGSLSRNFLAPLESPAYILANASKEPLLYTRVLHNAWHWLQVVSLSSISTPVVPNGSLKRQEAFTATTSKRQAFIYSKRATKQVSSSCQAKMLQRNNGRHRVAYRK